MAGGIKAIAASVSADLVQHLPRQNKKQREGLATLVATMLDVRGANPMDLAASLPRASERIDMRYDTGAQESFAVRFIHRLLHAAEMFCDSVVAER